MSSPTSSPAALDQKGPIPGHIERPPPYASAAEGQSSSQSGPPTLALPPGCVEFTSPTARRINGFWVYSESDDISASYIIDTTIPNLCTGDCDPKALMPHDERNKMFFKEEKRIPNVAFHSKFGSVKLTLSVEAEERCYISARSVHSMVYLQIPSLTPSKHFSLEATTHYGRIVILLPPTFDGLVQIRKLRYSSITFLPEFAKYAQQRQGGDEEALVRFTRATTPDTVDTEAALLSEALDHCLVGSAYGDITLGIYGVDHWEPFSLLKKIKSMWSK